MPRAGSRPRAQHLLAVLGLLASLSLALPTLAQSAPKLTDHVTDQAGVLSADDRAVAAAAIQRLDDEHNVQLWALFVDTTGAQSAPDYATATADANGLGGNDALIVVAVSDRRDAMWVGPLLTAVTNDEIDTILADSLEPSLKGSHWGQAVANGANALGQALVGDIAAGGGPSGGGPSGGGAPSPIPSPAPDLGWLAWSLPLVLIIGGGLFVAWWFTGWLAQHREAEERDRRTGELARRANGLLIQTDELLRSDEQELGFAEAEFGTDTVAPFRAALTQARAELQVAFKVRQQLDDEIPEDPATRERMLNEILARCGKAQELVETETERFRQLRDLERRAPEILGQLPAQVRGTEDRLPAAESALGDLEREAASRVATVRGNVAEARKRIALAREAVAQGNTAVQGGDKAAAARAVKAAQDAAAQASSLLDAIDKASQALDEARHRLPDALSAARADVAAARSALSAAVDKSAEPNVAQAEARLAAAEQAASADPHDLVLAHGLASEAEAAAGALVARIKAGEEQRAKAVAAADAALRAAGQGVDRASDFVAARHHGVGRRARTRLADAQAALEQARQLRDTDPSGSLAQAQRALAQADEAYRLATADFDETDAAGYGGTVVINGQPYPVGRGGPWPGSMRGPGWGSDIGGAILGGIIGGILSGGGRRGWGGGGFGMPRGGGFGGFGGGGRSGGGGFGGGGGGRARGGGW